MGDHILKLFGTQTTARRAAIQRKAGAVLLGVGAILLVASAAYFSYGVFARSGLSDLNYTSERPSAAITEPSGVPPMAGTIKTPSIDGSAPAPVAPSNGAREVAVPQPAQGPVEAVEPEGDAAAAASPAVVQDGSEEDDSADAAPVAAVAGQASDDVPAESRTATDGGAETAPATLGEAVPTAPKTLPDQEPAGGDGGDSRAMLAFATEDQQAEGPPAASVSSGDDATGASLIWDGVDYATQEVPDENTAFPLSPIPGAQTGPTGPATRILIPSIRLDSEVQDLDVVLLADSFAWETPKWVVGHIPSTALPGEQGQGWYFGHLESPIRGEGNVFLRLPQIPELLQDSGPVQIVLESDDRKYLYQVYRTEVVHQDDLRITDSGSDDITLVTCVPRYYYDHRLLVTAALIGVIES